MCLAVEWVKNSDNILLNKKIPGFLVSSPDVYLSYALTSDYTQTLNCTFPLKTGKREKPLTDSVATKTLLI